MSKVFRGGQLVQRLLEIIRNVRGDEEEHVWILMRSTWEELCHI
jgi:hypothetical protein